MVPQSPRVVKAPRSHDYGWTLNGLDRMLANPEPVVGLEGVCRARELARKPLVAIGGITRANARSVIEAGADAVAVISDLLLDPGKSAEEFLRILR